MADQKERILYIEDNPDNRTLVQRILVAEGCEVLTASNGPEGLALAIGHPPPLSSS